ncbi:NADH-quinone oxidoreductase subunit C [Cohnella sp. WQ 127256]|uniref:NADH-quinone oxidoreductase subunit C n=1 Tax=Cohnella sp. WQ 127256 TaxID=2938790 RepID=UPI002741C1DF|nr:NADH-quinone oxidoreductase subunit C [Cohnella sp. WQ 127256]
MSEENNREKEQSPAASEPEASESSASESPASIPVEASTETPAVQAQPETTATQVETPSPASAPASTAAQEAGEAPPVRKKETDEEKAARRKATIEAKEAAKVAAAQAAALASAQASQPVTDGNTPAGKTADNEGASLENVEPPKPPSPNQPRLDRVTTLLRELAAEDAVEEAYINEANDHLPTFVVKSEHWLKAAQLFRNHVELSCNYLRNVSGVDYETYMEVVYYPLNMDTRECYAIKVRADREQPAVPSVTPIWETANWNEREIYDLLGIDFPGHPDLKRIMMPDDWVGHPLRKDYVPLDPEV